MHNTWPGDLNLPAMGGALPEKGPALPVGPDYFAESILNGLPYRLRAVVTEGNPILGCANTNKVKDAFRRLDFYVYTGLFMEEAAYYADIILPVCSGFEIEGVYMRRDDRAIRWQRQAVDRVGESRPDWEIWIDLAQAMAKLDKKNSPAYWTGNLPFALEGLSNALGLVCEAYSGHEGHASGPTRETHRTLTLALPIHETSRCQHALSRPPFVVRGCAVAQFRQQREALLDTEREGRSLYPVAR
jgi:anaerobic selenocysteine-containing dehydrogenase